MSPWLRLVYPLEFIEYLAMQCREALNIDGLVKDFSVSIARYV